MYLIKCEGYNQTTQMGKNEEENKDRTTKPHLVSLCNLVYHKNQASPNRELVAVFQTLSLIFKIYFYGHAKLYHGLLI